MGRKGINAEAQRRRGAETSQTSEFSVPLTPRRWSTQRRQVAKAQRHRIIDSSHHRSISSQGTRTNSASPRWSRCAGGSAGRGIGWAGRTLEFGTASRSHGGGGRRPSSTPPPENLIRVDPRNPCPICDGVMALRLCASALKLRCFPNSCADRRQKTRAERGSDALLTSIEPTFLRGLITMVRSRPSRRSGIFSSLATSSSSAATRRSSSKPFSGRRISRMRNMMVTLTCLPCVEELARSIRFGVEIMDVDVGSVLDLFDVDLVLLLLGLARLLLLLEAEAPVVHDLADDGTRVGGDLDEIETRRHGPFSGPRRRGRHQLVRHRRR